MLFRKALKLGTRRSLLAWAQSGWVAREIERLNPGVRVELHGIETRGDQIQDVPLSSIPGKEFFVAELDQALQNGTVDLTVHSLKDLALERPSEFVCAAIPKRESPHDAALFSPTILERLERGLPIRIGTSSPRRLQNLPALLTSVLPRFAESGAHPAQLEFVEIRGNVNTRLSRVHLPASDPRALDCVILALAGLARLHADAEAARAMQPLLQGVRWMVLPLSANPTAPGQGALAVECRHADSSTRSVIGTLHDEASALAVQAERDVLAHFGGGCHQRFGATQVEGPGGLGPLLWIEGRGPQGDELSELRWTSPRRPDRELRVWDGSRYTLAAGQDLNLNDLPECAGRAVFVAHSRAVTQQVASKLVGARIWCSGIQSWSKLALQGIWAEGCSEGLGYDWITQLLAEPVLGLPPSMDWLALTHQGAVRGWSGVVGRALGTYRAPAFVHSVSTQEQQQLSRAEAYFWSSGSQFDALSGWVKKDAHHACGPGKTLEHLRFRGMEPQVFPSVGEWRKWHDIRRQS